MGGLVSSNGKTTPYDSLTAHREQLYGKQCSYYNQAERLKRQATAQLANNNKTAALNLGRQVLTAQKQAAIVGAIIANLDSQRAAMEQKKMTDETVKVLSSCVKDLGSNMTRTDKLEATIDRNDDAQAELREIAELLSCPVALGSSDTINDEQDILEMLGSVNVSATQPPTMGAAQSTNAHAAPAAYVDEDEAFLTWARLQLADNAPTHTLLNLPDTPNNNFHHPPPAYPIASGTQLMM